MKLKQSEVNTTKLFPSGAWSVSCIVENRLVSHTFYFTTKRDAVREFCRMVNSGEFDR